MDYFNSFFQNIKDRLSNPFFGSLFIVMLLEHWKLWYTLFQFEKDCTRAEKIAIIETLFIRELTWKNLGCDILIAIAVTIGGYVFYVLSKSLSLSIDFKLMPIITKKLVAKNTVSREEHNKIIEELGGLTEKYETQRKYVRDYSKNIDDQSEQIRSKDDDLLKNSETMGRLYKDLEQAQMEVANAHKATIYIKQQLDEANHNLQIKTGEYDRMEEDANNYMLELHEFRSMLLSDENSHFFSDVHKLPPTIIAKVRQLKEDKKWDMFRAVAHFLVHGGSMSSDSVNEMIKYGAVKEARHQGERLTPIGQVLWKYRNVLDEVQ